MSKTNQDTQESRQDEININYQKSAQRFFDQITSEISKYHNTMSDFQQEYTRCCKNMVTYTLSAQQEFPNKSGIMANIPENYQKIMDDSLKSYLKMHSLYKEFFRKILGTMQQSTKLLSNNSKGYVDLTNSVFQMYIPPEFSKSS